MFQREKIQPITIEDIPLEDVEAREQQLSEIGIGNPRMEQELRKELNQGDTKARRILQWQIDQHYRIMKSYETIR